jgi:hypothetical protein
MPLELIEADGADFRNARFLAVASDLAYFAEAEGAPKFHSELGLEARLISVGNTQVYVGEAPKAVVVVFRGTESPATLEGLKDWLVTNANNFLVLPEGRIGTDFAAAGVGARFHRGFMTALADIWDPLFAAVDALQKKQERPLWVTGHSLGGALALLAAWRFHRQFIPVHQIYTFGAPMIGNPAAAQAFEKEFPGQIFRYVDEKDLVPKLPAMSLLTSEYGQCLTEIVLCAARVVAGAAEGAAPASAEANALERLWGQVTKGVTDHLMTNYLARLAEKCKDLA